MTKPAETLPDDVVIELVDGIYSSTPPVLAVGLAMVVVAFSAAFTLNDMTSVAIGAAAIVMVFARVTLARAYRRARPATRAAALYWEKLYAAAAWSFSAIFAVLTIHLLVLNDMPHFMAACFVAVSYPAGVIVRVSIRPWIARTQILIALVPIATGLIVVRGMDFILLAALSALYLVACRELIQYVYATTLDRLLIRHALAQQAREDALTGLPNRRLFDERLAEAMTRGAQSAVLCLDLDGFKAVNDRFGHVAGDELLQQVAARLEGAMRTSDVVARLGGDEFVILQSPVSGLADVTALASRVVASLSEPYPFSWGVARVGVSVGAVELCEEADAAEALRRADEALYDAKRAGRGRFVIAQERQANAPVREDDTAGELVPAFA